MWVGGKGEFGIKDDSLVWGNVPGCGMADFNKIEETKREKRLGGGTEKGSRRVPFLT